MEFEIPALPYAKDALEPHISRRTLDIHYEKHHKGYLRKLEDAIGGTPQAAKPLEEIIRGADAPHVFNVSAQVWNHTFYWRSLAPDAPPAPEGTLAEAVDRDFGSLEKLRRELADAAKGEFGSGWAWLLRDRRGRLRVQSSTDAENPLGAGSDFVPLLTVDVWEHAYYLDYQNDRAKYVEAVIDHLLDWRFAERNFREAD